MSIIIDKEEVIHETGYSFHIFPRLLVKYNDDPRCIQFYDSFKQEHQLAEYLLDWYKREYPMEDYSKVYLDLPLNSTYKIVGMMDFQTGDISCKIDRICSLEVVADGLVDTALRGTISLCQILMYLIMTKNQ